MTVRPGYSEKIVHSELITAYIGLGSNLGFRAGNLLLGVRGLLEASFHVTRLSAIYETEPVDLVDSEPFLNMAAEIKLGGITPTQVMARLLRIEYLLGRRDKTLKRPRTIDLDLLFYGREQFNTEFLKLPHPLLHLRNFVLVPMNEIAPDLIHPVLNRSIRELLAESTDTASVVRWDPNGSVRQDPPVKSLDLTSANG